jgi:signal transduction histidine kinase
MAHTLTGEVENTLATLSVDREGRLMAADPRLLAMERAAGGGIGSELAIPALSALVRLARTLASPVSRAVIVADGDFDVSLQVAAHLSGDGVVLSATGWRAQTASPPLQEAGLGRNAFDELENDGNWTCDQALVFLTGPRSLFDGSGEALGKAKLHTLLRFSETEDGELPILAALAEHLPFEGQPAQLRAQPNIQLTMYGGPQTDAAGQFSGFSGGLKYADRAHAVRSRARPQPDIRANSQFAERLDAALRAPLARIVGDADAIASRNDGALRQDYVTYAGDISVAARHLLGLVDDLVDMQAIEQPGFSVAKESIDMADIARRASGLLGVRAGDRGIKIDAPPLGEMLPATGDFGRTLQILVNLIGNAVRYSPAGSMVWVRTEEEGDLAAVIVADQGKGIAIADQLRIFEKFHRVDPSEPGGSGLGLFISRKLARAMGGDITVDSAPGQGARFVLTLPRAD